MNPFKLLAAGLALGVSVSAQAYQIEDQYFGGNDPKNYGDIISDSGRASWFDVQGVDLTRSGNLLTVDVYTGFVDHVGAYSSLTYNGKGIGFGDLFLATSWNPSGSAADHYKSDNQATGTLWTYGFSLNNRWSTSGGNGTLYALNGATNDANAKLSNDFMKGGYYRANQEVAVDRHSTSVSALNDGTWAVDTVNNKISFFIDLSGTALLNSDTIALHWGMSCANDVIEGVASLPSQEVPEPASLALLALGLAAAWGRRRMA